MTLKTTPRPLDYLRRLDDAIQTLEGIVRGMAMDGQVDSQEIASLNTWLDSHHDLSLFPPFRECTVTISSVLKDGKIEEHERADLLWLLMRLGQYNRQHREASYDLQQLLGLVRGITANGRIHAAEVAGLSKWLTDHPELSDRWPCPDLRRLLSVISHDGRIDEREHREFLEFLQWVERQRGQAHIE